MIKPTFVVRDQPNKLSTTTLFDAEKVIKYYLSLHPLNRLIVDSPLYLLAVDQYNKKVKLSKVRPSVPDWFCGKVNPTTGELISRVTDAELRASSGVTITPTSITTLMVSPTGKYITDKCLLVGLPGSIEYTQCKENSPKSIDFNGSFETAPNETSSNETLSNNFLQVLVEIGRWIIENPTQEPTNSLVQTHWRP